jgi:hypothetical protein
MPLINRIASRQADQAAKAGQDGWRVLIQYAPNRWAEHGRSVSSLYLYDDVPVHHSSGTSRYSFMLRIAMALKAPPVMT